MLQIQLTVPRNPDATRMLNIHLDANNGHVAETGLVAKCF